MFGGLIFATSSLSRTDTEEVLNKSLVSETMCVDKRLTSQLIGVFDAGRCGLLHDVFALVVLQQMFNSPSSLCDAQIQQPPQEVGLRDRAVVRNVCFGLK